MIKDFFHALIMTANSFALPAYVMPDRVIMEIKRYLNKTYARYHVLKTQRNRILTECQYYHDKLAFTYLRLDDYYSFLIRFFIGKGKILAQKSFYDETITINMLDELYTEFSAFLNRPWVKELTSKTLTMLFETVQTFDEVGQKAAIQLFDLTQTLNEAAYSFAVIAGFEAESILLMQPMMDVSLPNELRQKLAEKTNLLHEKYCKLIIDHGEKYKNSISNHLKDKYSIKEMRE